MAYSADEFVAEDTTDAGLLPERTSSMPREILHPDDPVASVSSNKIRLTPFRVLNGFQAPGQDFITIHKNDEGFVAYVRKNSTEQEMYYVVIPSKNIKGFVPAIYVEVNKEVSYGDLSFDLNHETKLSESSAGTIPTGDEGASRVLNNAIEALLQTWYECREELELSPYICRRIDTNAKRHSVTTEIIKGCYYADTSKVLQTSDFTWVDLQRASRMLEYEPGIYGSTYTKFNKWPDRKAVIRIGSSARIAERVRQHEHKTSSGDHATENFHYRLAAEADEHQHFALCYLKDTSLLYIAEQVFVSLLDTYHPMLLQPLQLTPDVSTLNRQEYGKSEISSTGRVAMLKYYGPKHINISKKVRQSTGWPGGASRNTFDVSWGVNLSSPLAESSAKGFTLWTRINLLDRDVFFRTPTRASYHKDGVGITGIKSVRLNCYSRENCPKVGDKTYLQVEIMSDGSVHEHSYARLPKLDLKGDFGIANSVGIYVYWEDENHQWRRMSVSYRQLLRTSKDKADGMISRYVNAMAIYRYLMGKQAPLRIGETDFGLAKVHTVHFENWSQSFKLSKTEQKPTSMPQALPLTEEQIKTELSARGARFERVDGIACDQCKLLPSLWPGLKDIWTKCEMLNETTCKHCQTRGTICSWSWHVAVAEDGEQVICDDDVPDQLADFIQDRPQTSTVDILPGNPGFFML